MDCEKRLVTQADLVHSQNPGAKVWCVVLSMQSGWQLLLTVGGGGLPA